MSPAPKAGSVRPVPGHLAPTPALRRQARFPAAKQRVPHTAVTRLAARPSSELQLPQKLLVLAIALMPLQSALTYDLGFPLKPSEVLVILSLALSVLTGRLFQGPRALLGNEKWVLAFGAIVLASSVATLARAAPTGPLHGFTRSPTTDAELYTFYGVLVISMWAGFRQLPRHLVARAVVVSVWVTAVMVALQIVLSLSGETSLLHSLGYHSVPLGRPLPGLGEGLPRNGPFVEGQHLGFYCGVAFFVALVERRRWTMIACLVMLVVSQSTTGFVAVALGYAIALALRPSASSAVRLLAAFLVSGGVVAAVPALRTAIQIQLGKLGLLHTNFAFITKSIDLRAEKTDIGLRIMGDHPLLGVGPGRFGVSFYDYVDPAKVTPDYFQPAFRALAENVYAQIGAEFGVVALITFLIFVLGYVRRLAKVGTAIAAAAVALALGLVTQSDWTFLPAWTFLAYFAVVAFDSSTPVDEGRQEVPVTSPGAERLSPGRGSRRSVPPGSPRAGVLRRAASHDAARSGRAARPR